MTENWPTSFEFAIPTGWRAPQTRDGESDSDAIVAVHEDSSHGFAATIAVGGDLRSGGARLPDVADEAVERLRSSGGAVEVLNRTEVGNDDLPGLTQILTVAEPARAKADPAVLCQAFLVMSSTADRPDSVVVRFTMTATTAQVQTLADDFQWFLDRVRLSTENDAETKEAAATGQQSGKVPAETVPRHTRTTGPDR